jgi:ribonuclease BN (tRNA processing enzyme)
MPSIIFLGTGGDEYVVGKQLKGSGGIIVKVEGYQFHIDPGPGALLRAQQTGINLRENTAVLVSHAHMNHCNDVNAVLSAMSHNAMDVNGVLISNMTFANGDEESRIQPVLTNFHKKCVERIIVAKPSQRIGIENVEIQTLKAFHKDPSAMGFKLITPKFTLTYTSDTRYSRELIDQYKKSDILVLNLVHPAGEKVKDMDNLCFDDAVKILEKTKPKLAVITHFGKRMLQADPLNEARELQKLTGVQVLAALDGMSINPVSYSADAKQRTLGVYKEPTKETSKEETKEEEPEEEQDEGEKELEKPKEEQVTLVNDLISESEEDLEKNNN